MAFRYANPVHAEPDRRFFEDITEHKLAEDALRDSEARLRTLFNHSPDLIFTVDGEASILLTNRPLLNPLGGAGEKRSELILPPDVRDGYLQKLRQVFTSGRVEHFQYASSDDTWWEIRMVPITSATAVIAAMVVITDITENRKLQWQAIRNARLASLGVLSAGIAHEINNPNHAILTNASLLTRIWQDALPILDEYEREQGVHARRIALRAGARNHTPGNERHRPERQAHPENRR